MSGQEDAGRDAIALVQAALDHDEEALALLLSHCDQRETCGVLAALAAWLVSRFGPDNVPVLILRLSAAARPDPDAPGSNLPWASTAPTAPQSRWRNTPLAAMRHVGSIGCAGGSGDEEHKTAGWAQTECNTRIHRAEGLQIPGDTDRAV